MLKIDMNILRFFLLSVVVLSNFVSAQNNNTNTAQEFLKEKLRKEEIQRRSKQSGVNLQNRKTPKEQDTFFFDDKPCFWINKISIKGNNTLSDKYTRPITNPYVNHCLGKRSINSILKKINQAYIKRGYITSRALLPKQDLSKNQLEIVIIEGVVEELIVNDHSFADRSKLFMAMPQKRGEILNLRELEQGIDQFNRASSAGAKMKIIPGQAMGKSKVVINTQDEDQFRGRLGYDNEGSKNDKNRLRFGLEVDNILALNDSSSLYLIGSKNTNALAFNTSMPFRNFNINASYSYSEYLQTISALADVFGFSITKTAGIDYLIARNGENQTKIGITYSDRYSKRYLLDVPLDPQNSAIYRVFFNYSYRNKRQFWLFEYGLTQGLDLQNQDKKIKNNATDPVRKFRKLDASLNYSEQFSQLTLNNRLNMQLSFRTLYGQDQISIGGKSSIRGFGESSFSGESGIINKTTLGINWFGNKAQRINEQSWLNRQLKYSILRIRPSIFLEAGRVYDKANEQDNMLVGGGLAISYQYQQFSLQTSLARGLYSSDKKITPSYNWYLSLTLQAF